MRDVLSMRKLALGVVAACMLLAAGSQLVAQSAARKPIQILLVTKGHGFDRAPFFAMFDALIRLASGAAPANVGLLRLKTKVSDQTVEKVFLTPAAADGP